MDRITNKQIQATSIIHKLQTQIKKSGYVENLGQKELAKYKEYVFNKYQYREATQMYVNLCDAIDNL